MQNLNVITQENASASDELTNSSLELSQLADNLKKVVGFFKLDGEQATEEENTNNSSNNTVENNFSEQSSAEVVREARQSQTTGTTIDLGKLSTKDLDDGNYESF
jgi:methyl-accepting chemotaxis protein